MFGTSEQKPGNGVDEKVRAAEMDEDLGETTGHESVDEKPDEETIAASAKAHPEKVEVEADQEHKEAAEAHVSHGLSMFHMIFVMNPPPPEYQVRADDMYKHVVKKFSRGLKWEQARSKYVLRECEKFQSMKARHGKPPPSLTYHQLRN